MKNFKHFNATSIEEAVSLLTVYEGNARIMAGGTDLLGLLKDRSLPEYPEALVNLKTIPNLDRIEEVDGGLAIGGLVTLTRVAENPLVRERYPALAGACSRIASPHLRNMGTLSGNICQDIRCWYYRAANNRFPCLRKGGGRCYAHDGDSRYHSIFGGSVKKGCIAVHPSDAAPALVALDATVETSRRTLEIEAFFKVGVRKTTVLDADEVVTRILLPAPGANGKSAFQKFALRKSIDFPIVNCAVAIDLDGDTVSDARICLNAVYVNPRRVPAAEEVLKGKSIDEATAAAAAAGDAALADAEPLKDNDTVVPIAKTMVKRAILDCMP